MAQSIIPIGWLLVSILAIATSKSVQRLHGYGTIGGELANITELPHQVYIRYGSNPVGLECGGSIISSRHILTEKICVYYMNGEYTVVAATDDRKLGGEEYAVSEVTKHPDDESYIAVATLAKEIKFSDKARPIALAGPKYRIEDGAELIASGWGFNGKDSFISDKLRKVTMPKVSDDECKDTFYFINLSREFCAGGRGKTACGEDIGGPIIAKTRKGNVLVGVIRYGVCFEGFENRPSSFTKVSQFNKWINEVVKGDLQSNE